MKPSIAAAEQAIAAASESALEAIVANALRLLPEHAEAIQGAKLRRLGALHAAADGDLEAEVWRAILVLRALQGRKVMPNSQNIRHIEFKVAKLGAAAAIADLASSGKPTPGFAKLVGAGCANMTAEAIVVRFADRFDPKVVARAKARLAGI
jgi:hypothetical protein